MNNNRHKNKRNNILIFISKFLVILLFPLISLLSIVQVHAFNKDFYMQQYEKNEVSSVSGINNQDLDKITVIMLDYLKDKRDNLDIKVKINNQTEEAFGERERLHMEDVKGLFQKGFFVRNYGALLILLSIITFFVASLYGRRHLFKSLYLSSILSLGVMILLFILIKLDFMKYFTYFHKIFFVNDLWLLDPKKDVLIQMLPFEFFVSISTRIGKWFISLMIITFFISHFNLKITKANKKRI